MHRIVGKDCECDDVREIRKLGWSVFGSAVLLSLTISIDVTAYALSPAVETLGGGVSLPKPATRSPKILLAGAIEDSSQTLLDFPVDCPRPSAVRSASREGRIFNVTSFDVTDEREAPFLLV